MKKQQTQLGFTLVEMLVAVMILTLAVTALLSVSAGSAQSARYAKNKIVANWLAQASLDYIRNSRDSAFILNQNPLTDWWGQWVASTLGTQPRIAKGVEIAGTSCFGDVGCRIEIDELTSMPTGIVPCTGRSCPFMNMHTNGIYWYGTTTSVTSPFRVVVRATSPVSLDIVEITATVYWREGNTTKQLSQTTILTDWEL